MSENTKQHIIETGADLIHKNGFSNTGLQAILKASGVPKGSFYYYFDSKEAFGVEVAKYLAGRFAENAGHLLRDDSKAPLERIRNFFGFFRCYFEEQGWSRGCPIGNLAQEMGDLSKQLQSELTLIFDGMTGALAAVIKEAADSGQISKSLDPAITARFILGAWQGALIQMKVYKSGDPLDNFEHTVFEHILK